MDAELKRKGTPFFGGDKPAMLDLMIWPHIERLSMMVRSDFRDLGRNFLHFVDSSWNKCVSHAMERIVGLSNIIIPLLIDSFCAELP